MLRNLAILGQTPISALLLEVLREHRTFQARMVTAAQPLSPPAPDAVVTLAPGLTAGLTPFSPGDAHPPVLRVGSFFSTLVIGPWSVPGMAGCPTCADERFFTAMPDAPLQKRAAGCTTATPVALSAAGLRTAAWHIAQALRTAAAEGVAARCGQVVLLDLHTLTTTSHTFVRDSLCPRCAAVSDDSAEKARPVLRPAISPAPDSFRIKPLAQLAETIQERFVDSRFGVITKLYHELVSPFPVVLAELPLPWGKREPGVGRSHGFAHSRAIAILEALERYAGMQPRGKRTRVYGAFADLPGPKLDPRDLGKHGAEAFGPHTHLTPFDPQRPIHWVWGYSFARAQPLLVPEQCAYYGLMRAGSPDPPFVYEISNGCALGGCLAEAILHGIFECAERDSFLLTWYARLQLPEIPAAALDGAAAQLVAGLLRTSLQGSTVRVFDSTMEHGVPSVFALFENASDEPPKHIATGGCHLDIHKAIAAALHEMAATYEGLKLKAAQRQEDIHKMVGDARWVRTMEDHALLYADPRVGNRFDFLRSGAAPSAGAPSAPLHAAPAPTCDLATRLEETIARFIACDLDVIVVDQTPVELQEVGLHCVKVLIPGLLPMTFGHHMRRMHGLPRLAHVPVQLGFRAHPLEEKDWNPHPHPFP